MGLELQYTKDAMKVREGPFCTWCKDGQLSREGPETKSGY